MNKKDLIHRRNISITCFEGDSGKLVVEGTLSDERLFASLIYSANQKRPAGFVHTMQVAMELSLPMLEITAIEVEMPVTPMSECVQTSAVVKGLIGRRIAGGFTSEVRRSIGGVKGCLHTSHLIIAMASAAVQGAWSYYSRIRANGAALPPKNDESTVLNSCWMWREDGPLVERFRAAKRKSTFMVAIDGPAGAGKSTVSKELARRLGFSHLDTGALYRALALKLSLAGLKDDDAEAITELSQTTRLIIKNVAGEMAVFLDGKDVSQEIREEAVGMAASRFSAIPAVRAALLESQRRIGQEGDTVAEGRDMGSVVFPEAQVKVFLVANFQERAQRRYKELVGKGAAVAKEQILSEMLARDEQDAQREAAPMVAAPDAVIIDTSLLSVDAVVEKIAAIIATKRQ